MKKFLPAIAISFVFTGLMVSQLVINGQELSASLVEKNKARFALFDDQFQNLKDKAFSGNIIELKTRKEPIVIVNFWASWCKPCIAEFKSLNALLNKFPGKIFVLGINNDTEEPMKAVAKINDKYQLQLDSLVDAKGSYA